ERLAHGSFDKKAPAIRRRGSTSMKLVGMGGFEPPTTCTPSRCATRLRYIPIRRSDLFSIIPIEESQYFPKLIADLVQRFLGRVAAGAARRGAVAPVASGRRRARRRRPPRHLHLEPLLRAGYREALLVEELLDPQDGLDVAPAVDALARRVLRGGEGRKLGFPVAEDVRLGVGDLAHLTDLEEKLVRDLPFHAGRPRRLIRSRAEEFRGPEDDRSARLDEHLLSSLGIATASLPLLADHEGAEACDLDLLSVAEAVLDRIEDDLDQPSRLTIGQASMPLIDDARDVRLRHAATAPLCGDTKN